MNRYKKEKNPDRYSGKDRPGKVRSPNGPLGSRWAYPPGIAESGVGPVETIAGLAGFVLLTLVGANAFGGVAANQKEPARLKSLTEAVTAAAQRAAGTSFYSTNGGASGRRTTSGIGTERNKSDRNGMVKYSRGGRG